VASIQRREVERVSVDKETGEKRQVRAVVYRARYRDEGGKEHAGHFQRKVDAQRWLDVSGLGIIVTAASLVVMPVLTDVRRLATVSFHVRSRVHPDLTPRKGRSPMGGARSERHDGASQVDRLMRSAGPLWEAQRQQRPAGQHSRKPAPSEAY